MKFIVSLSLLNPEHKKQFYHPTAQEEREREEENKYAKVLLVLYFLLCAFHEVVFHRSVDSAGESGEDGGFVVPDDTEDEEEEWKPDPLVDVDQRNIIEAGVSAGPISVTYHKQSVPFRLTLCPVDITLCIS